MRTELKEGIFTEGFEREADLGYCYFNFAANKSFDLSNIIFQGKTEDIPEEVIKDCVIQNGLTKGTVLDDGKVLDKDVSFGYKQYKEGFGVYEFETAKQSIQSACDKQFCIIYKEVKP